MLFTLTYLSHEAHPLSEMELEVLLRQATRDNERLGITGVLLYAEGAFVQRLEGPRDAVMGLFARIRRDERHEVLMVTDVRETPARTFDGWGMALIDVRTLDAEQAEAYPLLVSLPATVQAHPDAVDDVATLLRTLVTA